MSNMNQLEENDLKKEYCTLRDELLDYNNRQLKRMRRVVIRLCGNKNQHMISYSYPPQFIDINNATLEELNRVFGDVTRGTGV